MTDYYSDVRALIDPAPCGRLVDGSQAVRGRTLFSGVFRCCHRLVPAYRVRPVVLSGGRAIVVVVVVVRPRQGGVPVAHLRVGASGSGLRHGSAGVPVIRTPADVLTGRR